MNKVSWFTKQLQHKTGSESLLLSLNGDEYQLAMQNNFILESYANKTFAACDVAEELEGMHAAALLCGVPYRLQVHGKEILFKILTRKIWFYDSAQALVAE